MSTPPLPDTHELLQRLLDDQIRPEEMDRLQEAMLRDPQTRRYYFDCIFACTVMRRCHEGTAELAESDLVRSLSSSSEQRRPRRVGRYFYPAAAVLVLGVLILVSAVLLSSGDPGPAIGTLAGAYEAQWRGARPGPGQPVYARRYDLREGVVQMDLDQGVSLFLEAPCRIELDEAGEVVLRNGIVAAKISPRARGFRVRTRTAVVTDLGTEFGVVAHADGRTEAHVLQGHVSVALDPNLSGRSQSLVLNEHQAAAVDATGQTMREGLVAQADLFLLRLPSANHHADAEQRLNLADIVGGGNGRGTGKRDRGIDPITGAAISGPIASANQARQSRFRPTPEFRGIDGVFVPNGTSGPPVISTTGLLFSQCPETTGGYYGGPISTGKFYDATPDKIYVARLNGVSFGTAAHPALTLHPNLGITFDLDEIRQDHPDIRIERFTAVCGIPKDAPKPRHGYADAWILIDGAVCGQIRYPQDSNTAQEVDVPIPAQARFLTLATTCPGLGSYSWVLFGDPFLEPAATGE